jgi:hypothetical protein
MKTFLFAAAVFAVGCGVSNGDALVDDGDTGLASDDSFELSTTKDSFVIARHDNRRCVSPMCGGFWVKDLNSTMQERYVSGFDFTGSGLSDDVQNQVFGAGDFMVVLAGHLGPKETRFNTRPLVVSAAFRGMPGKTFASNAKFFQVNPTRIACITTPCANLQATRVNRSTGHAMATDVDVTDALANLVDPNWLEDRVLSGRALVAGSIVRTSGGHVTVDASQVFVALPDRLRSCPKQPVRACPSGQQVAWEHTADRCVVSVGCTPMGVCAQYLPACEAGYNQLSWMNLCPRFACEPDFL